ncbi:TPA: chitin disaccharide deacetylase [Salmonella enterica]|uniref:Chitooligosaccharide deacetylase n=2 Tax=Salmonella enterica TaxID=28901 RepID=A0A757XFQ6_SALER|nr:chitin disaccharide deacetylase [Salmonella enterica subsp. enterica serovar Koketime]EAM8932148.1 chitin disaccharide deacetylase [Salmonella enterica]EBB4440872.1 chitin disaccharide deacetylase [Salmonella enterica]EBR9056555.1 chitin disaccharide deacetylase [Salmonella enterica subsp. enterica serovar Koketime]EBV0084540.1 chitin disaccharide deacetylase [Salmonella enterica subsp. enterica serovar Koketime]
MQRLLIVNADDFGLSKGVNFGIIEAARNGVVTSTTAMMNAPTIEHAAELSAQTPQLGVGLHFVLSFGRPLTRMPSLARDGKLGKWVWEVAEQGTLSTQEVERELVCQYQRFLAVFGRAPTHIDSHHHVHLIPQVYSVVAKFADDKGLPLRIDRDVIAQNGIVLTDERSSDSFASDFYAQNVTEAFFLGILDSATARKDRSIEIMCHPGFVDKPLQESKYCYPRLEELDVLTAPSLKAAITAREFRLGNFSDL